MKADGVLGLSPTNQGTQANLIYNSIAQNKMFSLAIAENVGNSKMTFGGYNLGKYAKSGASPIKWHQLTSNKYWAVSFTKATFGQNTIPITVSQMIIDSGNQFTHPYIGKHNFTSYLLMPTEDYLQFTTLLSSLSPCTLNLYSQLTCQCPEETWDQYPSLQLTVDGTTVYSITKFNYFSRSVAGMCTLKVMSMNFPASPSQNRFWLMGLNLWPLIVSYKVCQRNYRQLFILNEKLITQFLLTCKQSLKPFKKNCCQFHYFT